VTGRLTYNELRTLERLLARYLSELGEGAVQTVTAAHTVLQEVARRAGRVQKEPGRVCGWCGEPNVDAAPHLCDKCLMRSPSGVAASGLER